MGNMARNTAGIRTQNNPTDNASILSPNSSTRARNDKSGGKDIRFVILSAGAIFCTKENETCPELERGGDF
jgi:hypothetical protein